MSAVAGLPQRHRHSSDAVPYSRTFRLHHTLWGASHSCPCPHWAATVSLASLLTSEFFSREPGSCFWVPRALHSLSCSPLVNSWAPKSFCRWTHTQPGGARVVLPFAGSLQAPWAVPWSPPDWLGEENPTLPASSSWFSDCFHLSKERTC